MIDRIAELTAAAGGVLALFAARDLVAKSFVRPQAAAANYAIDTHKTLRKAFVGEPLSRGETAAVLLLVALGAFVFLLALAGPALALVSALAGPWLTLKAAAWRRTRRRRQIERQLPDLARALSGALIGGGSIRGALHELAKGGPTGPLGAELQAIDRELRFGVATEHALQRFTMRLRSHQVQLLVSAILVQREVGGDLARLLRDIAVAGEDQERLAGEVSAASAQARFTAGIVLALPGVGALILEVLSPGFIAGVFSSLPALLLVGVSLVLQLIGFFLIRQVSRAPVRGLEFR